MHGIDLWLQMHLVEKGRSRGVVEAFFRNITLQISEDGSVIFFIQGKRILSLIENV